MIVEPLPNSRPPAIPSPRKRTAYCEMPAERIELKGDCAQAGNLPDPISPPGNWPAWRNISDGKIINGLVYAHFTSGQTCVSSQGCDVAQSGIYRLNADDSWELAIPEPDALIAGGVGYLFSAAPSGATSDTHIVSRSTDSLTLAGQTAEHETTILGLAVLGDRLYSLIQRESKLVLEQRQIAVDGTIGPPGVLLESGYFGAGDFKASSSAIVWSETNTVVVADSNGKVRHVVGLPADNFRTFTALSGQYVFIAIESRPATDAGVPRSASVCVLDTETGHTRQFLSPQSKDTYIERIASNSSHFAWVQIDNTEALNSTSPYKLWLKPVGGAKPQLVACMDPASALGTVAADDETVYVISQKTRRFDLPLR